MSPVTILALVGGAAFGSAVVIAYRYVSTRQKRRRRARFAHDLRTPLTSIKAYAEILEDEVTEEERRRFAGIISKEADRMERMIRGRKKTSPAPSRPDRVERSHGGKTILVVDDDRFIVESTQRLLTREGYRTLIADGGEEALARARRGRPDLILMDLTMPRMTGEEALRRLQADPATRDIPVIITTGHADEQAPGGAAFVLSKPFSRKTLLKAMNRAMTGGPP